MTDFITAEEAAGWACSEFGPPLERARDLCVTVVHQAELLAEAREALQRIDSERFQFTRGRQTWRNHVEAIVLIARAALARLDSQEDQ